MRKDERVDEQINMEWSVGGGTTDGGGDQGGQDKKRTYLAFST